MFGVRHGFKSRFQNRLFWDFSLFSSAYPRKLRYISYFKLGQDRWDLHPFQFILNLLHHHLTFFFEVQRASINKPQINKYTRNPQRGYQNINKSVQLKTQPFVMFWFLFCDVLLNTLPTPKLQVAEEFMRLLLQHICRYLPHVKAISSNRN
jgi:hypothetical protein